MPPVKSTFWNGFIDCSPFILVVAPFGLLFGVIATEAGLNLAETMSMTILVIAGASQFTALALLKEQAPTLIIIFTQLGVPLSHRIGNSFPVVPPRSADLNRHLPRKIHI